MSTAPVESRVLTWRGGALLVVPDAGPADPVLAMDSWLVDEGQIRGLAAHRARFRAACDEVSEIQAEEVRAFWEETCMTLPRAGRWFPRVELGGFPPTLRLLIRPAPTLGRSVVLWPREGGDPRKFPRRKGPDLVILANARRQAIAQGADDALLTTGARIILEAAHGSVLWWHRDCLCLPLREQLTLPSVTVGLILQLAGEKNVLINRVDACLGDLEGCEVWHVNALHGIRPVRAWLNSPVQVGPAIRAVHWQKNLQALRQPI